MVALEGSQAAELIRSALAGRLSESHLAQAWPEDPGAARDIVNARESLVALLAARETSPKLAAVLSDELDEIATALESGEPLAWAAPDDEERISYGITLTLACAAAFGWSAAAFVERDAATLVCVVLGLAMGAGVMAPLRQGVVGQASFDSAGCVTWSGLALILGVPVGFAVLSLVPLRFSGVLGLSVGLAAAAGTAIGEVLWLTIAHRTSASS